MAFCNMTKCLHALSMTEENSRRRFLISSVNM
jgi:hypothetical protein